MECRCCSEKTYDLCCEPFHNQTKIPQNPEELMRSRFSAYALNLIDYLIETTHPDVRNNYSKNEIDSWSKENTWLKLIIVKSWDNFVHFKAYYQDRNGDFYEHEELSAFEKIGNRWFYLDGQYDF